MASLMFLFSKSKSLKVVIQSSFKQDLSITLKDMFKGALQEMNAEFDESMRYSKYDKTTSKTNYKK